MIRANASCERITQSASTAQGGGGCGVILALLCVAALSCGAADSPRQSLDAGVSYVEADVDVDAREAGRDEGLPSVEVGDWTPGIPLLITEVITVDANTRREGVDVLIEEGRILAIGEGLEAPLGALRIDGRGRVLAPALSDPHVHLNLSGATVATRPALETNLRANLRAGVLTVMDVGGPESLFALRDAIARGEVIGPTILATGPFLTRPGGHPCESFPDPSACRFVSPESAEAEATALVEAGADGLKVALADTSALPWMAPRLEVAAVEAATGVGVPVIAHIDANVDAVDAVSSGVAFLAHPVFVEPLDAPALAASVRAAGVHTTWYAFGGVLEVVEGRLNPNDPDILVADGVATNWERIWLEPDRLLDGYVRESRRWSAFARDNLMALDAAGAQLIPASDAGYLFVPHGWGLHRELRTLASFGLGDARLFDAVTVSGRELLGLEAAYVEVGAAADLLLVNGDPRQDIAAWSTIELVILEGRPLTRETIDTMDLRPAAGARGAPCFEDGDCGERDRCNRLLHACAEACDPPYAIVGACDESSFCLPTSGQPDGLFGACHPEPSCDLIAQDCDDEVYPLTCIPVDSDTNTCWPAGHLRQGERCDNWEPDLRCARGYFCSWLDSYCYRLCDPDDASSCESGSTCVRQYAAEGVPWFGVCLPLE